MAKQPQIMEHLRPRIFALIAMALCLAPPCVHANTITDVDQSLLAAIRIGAPPPPVAARDIAMVGIAMFDAVNAGDRAQLPALFILGRARGGRFGGCRCLCRGLYHVGEPVPDADLFSAVGRRLRN
jgi:hypothetical protein